MATRMSTNNPAVLVINPGTTSTKLALFSGHHPVWTQQVDHATDELGRYERITDQLEWRKTVIEQAWLENGGAKHRLDAVIGRGGMLRPMPGGVYAVNDAMCADLRAAAYGEHASNLGPLLARLFADQHKTPAYIVDPVTTDEFEPASRLSGVPGIERKCRNHALNMKAAARQAATDLGKKLDDCLLVIAHMGGGISVCALRHGRMIDSTDSLLGEGPFSGERAGTVPVAGMITLCMDSGMRRDAVVKLLAKKSGLKGCLGEMRLPAIYSMIEQGHPDARVVLDAMVRQIAKWIGAMTAVLHSSIDAIVLTGGMAHSERFVQEIIQYIEPLAPIKSYPGEFEMEALAEGGLRVLSGEENALEY